jgi:hypothetical protein
VKVSVAHPAASELAEALAALLPAEPHLDYQNFKPIADREGAALGLHAGRWQRTDEQITVFIARDASGRPLGALRVERRPFESTHFGLEMALVPGPVARPEPEARLSALRSLYAAAHEHLRAMGIAHVALRVSTRDRAGCWAAQESGAVYVDTQVSWMCALTGTPHDESAPGDLAIEEHDRSSIARLPASAWRQITAWAGEAFDRGPLVFDLTLPRTRAQGLYEAWASRVATGEWADAAMIARHRGEVVAFISMRHLPDVSHAAGTVVCGRGLGATLPQYRGLFTILQREMIARRPFGAAFMENETQASTIGSINVYAKLGMRYLRSTASFQRRLGGGS